MKTALLVIDAQRIYTTEDSELFCPDHSATVKNINKLIRKHEESSLPVIYIRHVHKADGSDLGRMFDYLGDIVEEFSFSEGTDEVEYDAKLRVVSGCSEILKTRYDAFEGTSLRDTLKRLDVKAVTVCGFMTNFCCESTARSAHDKDYYVNFIVDATGTPGLNSYDESDVRAYVKQALKAGIADAINTSTYIKRLANAKVY